MVPMRNWILIVCLFLLGMAVLFSGLWYQNRNSDVYAPFILTDHHGRVYDSSLDERYKLVFFGFTHCPAVCPAGLTNMKQVFVELGAKPNRIQPIFITVDPERDTPEVLKDYVEIFDAGILGLTGTPSEIETVKRRFKVYAGKVELADGGDYTMDHTAHIYLLDQRDKLLEIYDYRLAPEEMAKKIGAQLDSAI